MKNKLTLEHSLIGEDYETQVNKHGYTLGEKSEHFAKIKDALFRLRLNGYIADSEMPKILKRIHKDIYEKLKKMEE